MNNTFTAGLLLLISLFTVTACDKDEEQLEQQAEEEAKKQGRLQEAEITVDTQRIALSPFYYPITARGTLQAGKEAKLLSPAGGRVVATNAQNGKFVPKGGLLLQLDQAALLLDMQVAKQEMKQKEQDFELMVEEYAIRNPNADKEMPAATKAAFKARSGYDLALIKYEQAKLNLSKTKLTAPFGGVLTDWKVNLGNQLNAGQEIGLLHSNASFVVEVEVPETDLPYLKVGLPATIRLLAYPDTTFSGSIAAITPYVNPKGMVPVTIKLPRNNYLMPGMKVRADLLSPMGEQLLVPKEAIVIRSGKEVVFTVEDGLAKWNYVETGRENGKMVEVLEGVEKGMLAIVSNNIQLSHDAPVTVARKQTTTD